MINVSEAFKAAIKADTELMVLEADFSFIPPGAAEGSSVSALEPKSISKLAQVNAGEPYGLQSKLATLELDRWALDGTFKLVDTADSAQHVGYFSTAICDEAGAFETVPYVDYTMDTAYDLIGITVWWDEPCGEWATSCTLEYYDAGNMLLKAETFANNEAVSLFDLAQTGVKRFRLKINAWNAPNRMAKVSSMLPGQILYLGNYAFSFEHTESIAVFDPSITFPEFVIKFSNADKKFDIVNPTGLVAFLRQKMVINSRLKLLLPDGSYEAVSVGAYYLYSWPESSEDEEESFTCKPSMAFATGYYINTTRGTQTVAQAAATIFTGAEEAYMIDADLQSIVVNQYIGDKVPRINAMGQLAVACASYWFIDRDGSYHLRKWAAPTMSNSIDYDSAWSRPNISQRSRVTSVNVPYTTYDEIGNIQNTDNVISLAANDGKMEEIQSAFIPSLERANAVAEAALNYYALRLNFESSYRGDPTIQAGDSVTVENDYGNRGIVVTEHDLTRDENGLSGTVKGLGVD